MYIAIAIHIDAYSKHIAGQMNTRLYLIFFGLLYCKINAASGHNSALSSLKQRIKNLETSVERDFDAVKKQIGTLKTNVTEDIDAVEQQSESLEMSLEKFEKKVENQLKFGGKKYQTVPLNGKLLKAA